MLAVIFHKYTVEKDNLKETVREIFTEYLSNNKYRKTSERFAILDAIYSIDGSFEVEYLIDKLKENDKFVVSRATVYNTISLLTQARLVIKNQSGSVTKYEKSYKRKSVHQLVCVKCGKTIELVEEDLQRTIEKTKRRNRFSVSHYALFIYGICGRCERKTAKKKNN